jgi:ATP-dependent RNA helicase RhlE
LNGVDVLVATPGRLLDLVQSNALRLERRRGVRARRSRPHARHGLHPRHPPKIVAKLPAERQTLLFSATMPADIAELARQHAEGPGQGRGHAGRFDRRADRAARDPCRPRRQGRDCSPTFAASRRPRAGVHPHQARRRQGRARLNRPDGIAAEAIHGNKSQNQRERVLAASARAAFAPWSPPTSPPAASTSTASATSSTSTCPTSRRPTSTASAAPRAPARTASRSRFCSHDEREYLRDIEKLIRIAIPARPQHSQPRQDSRHEPRQDRHQDRHQERRQETSRDRPAQPRPIASTQPIGGAIGNLPFMQPR